MTNTTEVQTLTSWLLGRIAEDEAEAGASIDELEQSPPSVYDVQQGLPMLAAGEPERVLAECAAKRAIVSALEDADSDGSVYYERGVGLDFAVRHLAAVYADAPGYDAAWAVS